jgi:hypothetical protein
VPAEQPVEPQTAIIEQAISTEDPAPDQPEQSTLEQHAEKAKPKVSRASRTQKAKADATKANGKAKSGAGKATKASGKAKSGTTAKSTGKTKSDSSVTPSKKD